MAREIDFVEEGELELLSDSVTLDGEHLKDLLMKHLHIQESGKRIRLGRARISIEWLEEGYREEARRKDTIIAQLTQRIPELPLGNPQETTGVSEAHEGEHFGTSPRS